MITIIIDEVDGGETVIKAVDQTSEQALQAHGYAPDSIEFSVEKSEIEKLQDRIEELENTVNAQ